MVEPIVWPRVGHEVSRYAQRRATGPTDLAGTPTSARFRQVPVYVPKAFLMPLPSHAAHETLLRPWVEHLESALRRPRVRVPLAHSLHG
jgi:hypothetical protein